MIEQEKNNRSQNFGEKLLRLFVQDSSAASEQSSSISKTHPSGTSTSQFQVANVPATAATPTGAIDTKFVDHFATVLSQTNLKGPDYFEFREMLKNLGSLGLLEEKQFQAAWASFTAMGGSSDLSVLTTAASQYVTALNSDREAFLKSVEEAIEEKVGVLQNEQKKLLSDNETLARQIADLQTRISTNTDRLAKIGGEIEDQSQKLNQNKNNYEVTHAMVVNQIKRDISKIETYLK